MNLLRTLLLENLGLKLVALLLALVVYVHVFTERPATMVVAFPLEVLDLADTLALAGRVPESVQAELQGTGKQFIRLWLTEPKFKISLAGVGPGHFRRRVQREDLPLIASDRLEVQRLIGPDTLDLVIERRLTREVPVAPRVEAEPGRIADGTESVRVEPAVARVRGPKRAIASLDSVRLAPVRVRSQSDTVRAEVAPTGIPERCVVEPGTFVVSVTLKRS